MEDPAHPNYPQDLLNVVGPRNMVHSWATDKDDPTEMPRWGKIGKQKIEDAGTLYPKRMETVDDEIRDLALKFIDKAKKDGKPFFCWLNPTRMHIVTHLSEKYEKRRATRRMAGRNRKPAWPSSMTTSAWCCRSSRTWARTTTPSSSSPPTTAPNSSPGPMAERRRSRSAKGRSWKAASACPASCAGPARSRRTRCRTASSPAWTGSPPSSPPPAIPPSPTTCSRA